MGAVKSSGAGAVNTSCVVLGRRESAKAVARGGRGVRRNAKRFRGGLVFKAHRLLYHLTLGSRVKEKKRKRGGSDGRRVEGREAGK